MLQSDVVEECLRMVEEARRRAKNCSDAASKAEWLRLAGECLKLAAQLRTLRRAPFS